MKIIAYCLSPKIYHINNRKNIFNCHVLIVSYKNGPQEQNEPKDKKHYHLSNSIENTWDITLFDPNLKRLFH